jgi:hypothetical protein
MSEKGGCLSRAQESGSEGDMGATENTKANETRKTSTTNEMSGEHCTITVTFYY